MGSKVFSVILLPTLKCNADCDYCFEDKTNDRLSLERLQILIDKVLDHLVDKDIPRLMIHWQGGEAMTLPPSWFAQAYALIGEAAAARGRTVTHGLQTNMIGYSPKWNEVIRTMFDASVSTSLDYPNLYRRRRGQDPSDYNAVWTQNVRLARDAGIEVQVISVPNAATLEIGAERFYSYLVDELDVRSFQVNTPFPGGETNLVKRLLPLDTERPGPLLHRARRHLAGARERQRGPCGPLRRAAGLLHGPAGGPPLHLDRRLRQPHPLHRRAGQRGPV